MGTGFSATLLSQAIEAVANATNMTDAKYLALLGAASPFTWKVLEVSVSGEATSSTLAIMILSRDSTVGATLTTTNSYIAALHPSSAAARISQFTGATTKPQRSSTLHLLNPSFNAWGGVWRWVASPGSELYGVGATASFGEMSLSGFTGSGTPNVSAQILLEEM